eukprot:2333364-Rhodomonas_salina.5
MPQNHLTDRSKNTRCPAPDGRQTPHPHHTTVPHTPLDSNRTIIIITAQCLDSITPYRTRTRSSSSSSTNTTANRPLRRAHRSGTRGCGARPPWPPTPSSSPPSRLRPPTLRHNPTRRERAQTTCAAATPWRAPRFHNVNHAHLPRTARRGIILRRSGSRNTNTTSTATKNNNNNNRKKEQAHTPWKETARRMTDRAQSRAPPAPASRARRRSSRLLRRLCLRRIPPSASALSRASPPRPRQPQALRGV